MPHNKGLSFFNSVLVNRKGDPHRMDAGRPVSRTFLRLVRGYAGTHERSRIVFVGFWVLNTAFTFMPNFGVPSER